LRVGRLILLCPHNADAPQPNKQSDQPEHSFHGDSPSLLRLDSSFSLRAGRAAATCSREGIGVGKELHAFLILQTSSGQQLLSFAFSVFRGLGIYCLAFR
jgi:hypothetical protein